MTSNDFTSWASLYDALSNNMLPLTLMVILAASVILLFLLLREKKILDKLMFLNLILVQLTMLMTVYSVWKRSQMILDVSMTFSLMGFLATAVVLRFLLKGGHQR